MDFNINTTILNKLFPDHAIKCKSLPLVVGKFIHIFLENEDAVQWTINLSPLEITSHLFALTFAPTFNFIFLH